MLSGWLGTPPPERGRSTRPSRMFSTWSNYELPKSATADFDWYELPKPATADFDWRSGGGRDPHPIPPLVKEREEIAARWEPNSVLVPRTPGREEYAVYSAGQGETSS